MKAILKSILLWLTVLSVLSFLAGGLESLVEAEKWIEAGLWLIINIILCLICKYVISYKELYKLSGNQWIDSILK